MRSDLGELVPGEEEVAQLRILLGRRRDLVIDQNRTITRLGEALLSLSPALERALDLNRRGPLTLLTHYQSPAQLRRAGHKRIAAYLRSRGVKGFNSVADKALTAAKSQSIALPAESIAARIVAELATEILTLKDHVELINKEIEQRFFDRPEAEVLASLPGMGPLLGAEFLVAVGNLSAFDSADHLAAYSGLVPAANDSGKRVGNNRFLGEEGTRTSRECSTKLPLPACAVHRSPGPSTTEREPRASSTSRHSSRSPVGG
jgi:transposase